MGNCSICWLLSLAILFLTEIIHGSSIPVTDVKKNREKTAVFLSPKFDLEPGSVCDKYYYDIDFPRGHVFIKEFIAEVVDESGNSVPLHETYLHHWVVLRYYERKHEGSTTKQNPNPEYDLIKLGFQKPEYILGRNSGVCNHGLIQYFGLGSETRKTDTHVPDPYGIEIGNPSEIPEGYEEKWLLNVHAIDTRGAEDRLGCTECRCDLYNVTEDIHGRALDPNYIGGLKCCYDQTKCRIKEGFQGWKRGLFLKYTVKYLDWQGCSDSDIIVPVKIYIFDVTDTWKRSDDHSSSRHDCQIEYQVEACSSALPNNECIDSKSVSILLPDGGDLIYGAAHQHTGGIGSTLYGEDGRILCSSTPIYGEGKEAGNEGGYIVGMSTCYPKPGSIKISNGEMLTIVSNYSSSFTRPHTGVMGLFYILLANSNSSPNHLSSNTPKMIHKRLLTADFIWGSACFGIVALIIAGFVWQRRNKNEDNYEPIIA